MPPGILPGGNIDILIVRGIPALIPTFFTTARLLFLGWFMCPRSALLSQFLQTNICSVIIYTSLGLTEVLLRKNVQLFSYKPLTKIMSAGKLSLSDRLATSWNIDGVRWLVGSGFWLLIGDLLETS
jgi:hypothetical protein